MNYLEAIKGYNTRRADPSPSKTALLVIDMQYFFDAVARRVLGNVKSLIDASRAAGIPVIFTRHGHRNLDVDGGMLAEWWNHDLAVYGSPEWEIFHVLAPGEEDPIIDKTRYSAFHGTGLEKILRDRGIEEVIITGVLTNCCCETTARDAFMRDFRVFIAGDATATVNDELHLSSLKGLSFACAYVMSTEGLAAALSKG